VLAGGKDPAWFSNVVGIMPVGSASHAAWFSPMAGGQLLAQAIGCVCIMVVGGGLSFVWFKLSNFIVPMRVPRDAEVQGCDIPEMGARAYPDFELKTT